MTDSKKIDDGGPAFSGGLFEPQHGGSNDREPWNPGMSLRDWFAGKVLTCGDWSKSDVREISDEDLVTMCHQVYRIADAMLIARKGGAQ